MQDKPGGYAMTATLAAPRAEAAKDHALWIAGRARPARSGAQFARVNPYDGSVAARFANADAADAEAAIAAARTAFDSGPWPRSAARARHQVLMRAAQLVAAHGAALAESMVRESGKPVRLAQGEVAGSVKTFEYYAGAALAMAGQAIGDRVPDALGLVLHEPVGVAALITPWNFPLLNPVCKLAPALAAGCTVVIKPSHLCPGPAVMLGRLLAEAGLPEGVFNVVTSDLERGAVVGQVLAASPLVDKVAFTGSTATGRAVMRAAAGNTKRVSLELGGKSANIVFDDAPFDEAAATAINAFCFNSGQQCSAGTRLLVQRGIHDRFLDAVVANARRQVLGDPMRETTTMGPLVNPEQHQRVCGYVAIGRQEGRLATGGGAPAGDEFRDSLFVEPTVFDGVPNGGRLAQEEVFGPVLAVIPFDGEDEAVRLANDSRYGLAGGVWSRSIGTALRVARAVRTGKMFVNCYNSAGLDDMPHGGYKDSGIGREFGPQGLEEFQQLKTVQIKLIA
jgi:acyl-CoA reductase-like NAD-dependent aldehyde dehydrogenase